MLLECNIVCLIRFLPTCRYLLDTWGLAALQYMLQVTSKPQSACGDEGSGGGLWWVVAGPGPGPGPRVAEWRLPGPADIGSYSCYDAAVLLPPSSYSHYQPPGIN